MTQSTESPKLNIDEPGALEAWLRENGLVGSGEQITIEPLAGGVSNRTLMVRRAGGKDWVVKQALAQLRVKVEWFSDPARIGREALGIKHLSRLAPEGTIPQLVFEDRANYLLGMEAVPQPHENWKTLLLRGEIDPDHIRQFATLLATIQRRSNEDRAELAPLFDDRSFFQSLRVEAYYGYSAQQASEAAPFLHALIETMLATRQTLVHADYSPKNVLVHEGKLILLDHETIHFGDPAFDMGFSMTHLLSKAHHLAEKRAEFAEAAQLYWKTYREQAGSGQWLEGISQRAVRHILACLLARVAGRSPLEYFSAETIARQRRVVIGLMQAPPETVESLIEQFIEGIATHDV